MKEAPSHMEPRNRAGSYVRQPGANRAFFLRGMTAVSNEAVDTARGILQLRETHRAAITKHLGRAAANGHKVLEQLYRNPILSVKGVQAITGTTYAAANQLVARLTALGIFKEITGFSRNRRFRNEPYVDLFSDATD